MSVRWSPTAVDLGRHKAKLTVSDGNKSTKLKLTFDVAFPLFVAEPDEPGDPKTQLLEISSQRPVVDDAGVWGQRGKPVPKQP